MSIAHFAEVFSKYDAGPYILEIKKYLDGLGNNKEIATFIYSEIIWNYFLQDGDYNKDILKNAITAYPHNPEFHNTYAMFLLKNKTYDKAIFEHQRALSIDPFNYNFIECYFVAVKAYFEYMIENRKIDEADKYLSTTLDFIHDKKIDEMPNTGHEIKHRIYMMKDRINDHKAIEKQISFSQREIENTIRIEQRRLIEVLGIFSAVLAFILTNISIALSNLTAKQVLIIMVGMAIILLIFAISISYLFGPRLRYPPSWYFLKRPKFWAIIVLAILLLAVTCVI